MKSGADYGWIIIGVIVIAIAIFWKPIMGAYTNLTGGSARKEKIAAGKVIFYDTERWEGKGSYKSCAMCHARDFKPEPGKDIKMPDYKAGEQYILEGMRGKYSGVLQGDDKLMQEMNECLALPSRMNVGKVSAQAAFMSDLATYVKSL